MYIRSWKSSKLDQCWECYWWNYWYFIEFNNEFFLYSLGAKDDSLNVWTDNPTYHPDFVTRNNNGNIKHNEGMSLEFTAPGNLDDLIENDSSGDSGFFPRKSQSISVWVKEYDWTDRDNKTIIYEWTSGMRPSNSPRGFHLFGLKVENGNIELEVDDRVDCQISWCWTF